MKIVSVFGIMTVTPSKKSYFTSVRQGLIRAMCDIFMLLGISGYFHIEHLLLLFLY